MCFTQFSKRTAISDVYTINLVYKFLRASQGGRAHKRETQQRASYSRWPLAASAVKNNHCLIAFEITEKYKIIYRIVGALASFWVAETP
jgi:hypothetical protein